jgi:fatty-acyl-CoA synthase
MCPDGYVALRDRAKDIIISGGENISSIEVEEALTSHAAVLEVAVVAAPTRNGARCPSRSSRSRKARPPPTPS